MVNYQSIFRQNLKITQYFDIFFLAKSPIRPKRKSAGQKKLALIFFVVEGTDDARNVLKCSCENLKIFRTEQDYQVLFSSASEYAQNVMWIMIIEARR